jgi:hypothetical protein
MTTRSGLAAALAGLALAAPAAARDSDGASGWPPVYSAEAGKGPARVDSALRVAIEYPEAGQEVVGPDNRGFVTGTAYQAASALGSFDIYVVLDVSDSTKRPSGADIDGDGAVGVDSRGRRIPLIGVLFDSASDDPGDSVLACEVKAAKTLLNQLDSDSTRVGLIRFSGDYDNATPDAEIIAPLTRDYDALAVKLDELLRAGPSGETNLVAALQLATLEFERAFLAARDSKVQRLALVISDGRPTLPFQLSDRVRNEDTVEAARDAAQISARIYPYVAGRQPDLYLDVLQQVADVSGGKLEKVAQPADLVASFQALDLAQVSEVKIQNLTLGKPASDVLVDPYGTFSGIIPLREGENELEVYARSTSGAERREVLKITYRNDGEALALPVRALERRGRLLEQRLRERLAEEIQRAKEERRRAITVTTD